MRTSFLAVIICVLTWSCEEEFKYNNQLVIDSSIKEEVVKYVKGLSKATSDSQSYLYDNNIMFDYFVDDSLKLSFKDQGYKTLCTTFHRKTDDAILMTAEYDLLGGVGHAIRLVKDEVNVYYIVSAKREAPSYALNPSDVLAQQLYIPCSNFNLVLSQIPKGDLNESIYGMLEFETDDFYKKDKRTKELKKEKNTVKIYFKSNFLPS